MPDIVGKGLSSFLGLAGLAAFVPALYVFVFSLDGLAVQVGSFMTHVGEFTFLLAIALACVGMIVCWWRPEIAGMLFIAAIVSYTAPVALTQTYANGNHWNDIFTQPMVTFVVLPLLPLLLASYVALRVRTHRTRV